MTEPKAVFYVPALKLLNDDSYVWLQKKDKDGVRPSRGKLYILSRTREKNGSIVNENAAKVIVCIFKSFFSTYLY